MGGFGDASQLHTSLILNGNTRLVGNPVNLVRRSGETIRVAFGATVFRFEACDTNLNKFVPLNHCQRAATVTLEITGL